MLNIFKLVKQKLNFLNKWQPCIHFIQKHAIRPAFLKVDDIAHLVLELLVQKVIICTCFYTIVMYIWRTLFLQQFISLQFTFTHMNFFFTWRIFYLYFVYNLVQTTILCVKCTRPCSGNRVNSNNNRPVVSRIRLYVIVLKNTCTENNVN